MIYLSQVRSFVPSVPYLCTSDLNPQDDERGNRYKNQTIQRARLAILVNLYGDSCPIFGGLIDGPQNAQIEPLGHCLE